MSLFSLRRCPLRLPVKNACPLNGVGCARGQGRSRCGARGPWVVVGQLVTRVPPKKCHLQLKQTSNAVDVAVGVAVAANADAFFGYFLLFAGYFLAIAFFNRRRTRTLQMAEQPPEYSQTLHSQHPAVYRFFLPPFSPSPRGNPFALVTCVNYNFAFGVAFKSIKRNKQ